MVSSNECRSPLYTLPEMTLADLRRIHSPTSSCRERHSLQWPTLADRAWADTLVDKQMRGEVEVEHISVEWIAEVGGSLVIA